MTPEERIDDRLDALARALDGVHGPAGTALLESATRAAELGRRLERLRADAARPLPPRVRPSRAVVRVLRAPRPAAPPLAA